LLTEDIDERLVIINDAGHYVHLAKVISFIQFKIHNITSLFFKYETSCTFSQEIYSVYRIFFITNVLILNNEVRLQSWADPCYEILWLEVQKVNLFICVVMYQQNALVFQLCWQCLYKFVKLLWIICGFKLYAPQQF